MRRFSSIAIALMLLVALLGLTACSQPTPEERVAQARSRYEATLNGFVVQQQPIVSPEEPAEGTGAEVDDVVSQEEAADVEGSEETAELPIDLSQDVLLDIVIRYDGFEKLDGITVDIAMADGERELQVWRVWFDTSGIEKGPGVQYSYTLENVDYQPGYGFGAEIRYPVPPEEHSEYKEFADLAG